MGKRGNIKFNCKKCGNESVVFPADVRKGGGVFCSRECYFAYKSERKSFDRKAWQARWYKEHKEEKRAKELARKAANPEKYVRMKRDNQRQWRASHPDRDKQKRDRYVASHPKFFQPSHYKRKYGITIDFVGSEVKAQNNRCKICRDVFEKTPSVDHDHNTGKYRSMLDRCCNSGLGQFKDDLATIFSALLYLVGHKNIPTIS